MQLSDGELALGSPAFFLSSWLIVITVIIEAFHLDKLITEKREFVLLIFFKKNCGNSQYVIGSNPKANS